MPVALMGLSPSRAFPSARSRSASRRPQPSLRWPRGPRQARPDEVVHQSPRTRGGVSSTGSTRPVPLDPHSGPGTSTESVARHRGLAGGRARLLSWGFDLSRVLRQPDLRSRLTPARSSHGLDRPALRDVRDTPCSAGGRPSGVSISLVADIPALASTSTLMRFFNLVPLLSSSRATAVLAHVFASGPEPRRRAPQTLFGLPRPLAGAP